jgi:hypothetical protein
LPPLVAVAAVAATVVASLLLVPAGRAGAPADARATSRDVPGAAVARAATLGPERRFPIDGPAVAASRRVAVAHWGAEPCGGQVEMVWTALPAGTNAVATWRNPFHAWNAPRENFDCRIQLNANGMFDFPKLCTVITHEFGHLLGRPHTPERGQLMSAYYERPIQPCVDADPGAAPASAPPPAPTGTARRRGTRSRGTTVLSRAAAARAGRRCVVRLAHGRRTRSCRRARRGGPLVGRTSRRCVIWLVQGRRVERCTTVPTALSRARTARARR